MFNNKLKENIRMETSAPERNDLYLVMQNVPKRLQLCEMKDGGHLQNILFLK